jgi:hypothetical protein
MTNSMLFLAVMVFGLMVVGALTGKDRQRKTQKQQSADNTAHYSYTACGSLFSKAERSFLGVLELALADNLRVFGKVRVADLLEPAVAASVRQAALNKIIGKHVDFVICSPQDFHPVAVIELDDKSHLEPKRQTRDALLDKAFQQAGLPIFRFTAQATYSLHEVRAKLGPLLDASPPSTRSVESQVPDTQQATCSKCGGRLVERVSRKGSNSGDSFLGCENYPRCRETGTLPRAAV